MYRIPYENEQITKTIAAPYAPVEFTEEEQAQFRENIGASSGSVRYDEPQDLTEEEKAQARENIGAGSGSGGGRNLLDNGWFTVNQRNATTGVINAYFVDRWFGDASSAAYLSSITVNADKTITITPASGQSAGIAQKFEDVSQITGKTVTASVMYADGTIDQGSAVFGASTTLINNANIYVAIKGAGDVIFFRPKATKTLKAVKLELGEKSTLANDSAPDYALELTKSRMSTADSEDRYANAIMGVYCQTLENRTGYLDFDDVMIPGFYVNGSYGTALIVLRTGAYGYSGLVQIAIKYNDLKLNIREYHSGVWSAWVVK